MNNLFILLHLFIVQVLCDNFSSINLPDEHLPYYFSNYPQIAKNCTEDPDCPYKNSVNENKCWGYEFNCPPDSRYSTPNCLGDHRGWVNTKNDQIETFYTQTDFGYIKQQLRELKVICEPFFADDSSLECTDHMRFCRGRNLMVNFTGLAMRNEPIRYKMDVLDEGQIGGYCDFKKDILEEQSDHISPLQSWGPEIRHFTKLNRRPIIEDDCDLIIEKPTYIMKIDASMNYKGHSPENVQLF